MKQFLSVLDTSDLAGLIAEGSYLIGLIFYHSGVFTPNEAVVIPLILCALVIRLGLYFLKILVCEYKYLFQVSAHIFFGILYISTVSLWVLELIDFSPGFLGTIVFALVYSFSFTE